jgi:hypothetical protein
VPESSLLGRELCHGAAGAPLGPTWWDTRFCVAAPAELMVWHARHHRKPTWGCDWALNVVIDPAFLVLLALLTLATLCVAVAPLLLRALARCRTKHNPVS